jgi:hypothetical protein
MPEEETDVEQLEPIRSASREIPGVLISRVIEYLPAGGNIAIPRDCSYGGQSYSKGAVINMTIVGSGDVYECTGDKDGSWKKVEVKPT